MYSPCNLCTARAYGVQTSQKVSSTEHPNKLNVIESSLSCAKPQGLQATHCKRTKHDHCPSQCLRRAVHSYQHSEDTWYKATFHNTEVLSLSLLTFCINFSHVTVPPESLRGSDCFSPRAFSWGLPKIQSVFLFAVQTCNSFCFPLVSYCSAFLLLWRIGTSKCKLLPEDRNSSVQRQGIHWTPGSDRSHSKDLLADNKIFMLCQCNMGAVSATWNSGWAFHFFRGTPSLFLVWDSFWSDGAHVKNSCTSVVFLVSWGNYGDRSNLIAEAANTSLTYNFNCLTVNQVNAFHCANKTSAVTDSTRQQRTAWSCRPAHWRDALKMNKLITQWAFLL